INFAAQEKDPTSVLNHFKQVVALRKANKVLVYGKYTLLDKLNQRVYAYTRELGKEKMLIILNFSNTNCTTVTGINTANATLLLSNYTNAPTIDKNIIHLRPFEAIIYKL
ncbi:MAG: alpha-glucosidase C-terminal domain-containing protein, partial [Sediminibacterium sp.]|nr:alpha-glucosidase C-terminal domain-containing protein [Sediminibacterium sp.]